MIGPRAGSPCLVSELLPVLRLPLWLAGNGVHVFPVPHLLTCSMARSASRRSSLHRSSLHRSSLHRSALHRSARSDFDVNWPPTRSKEIAPTLDEFGQRGKAVEPTSSPRSPVRQEAAKSRWNSLASTFRHARTEEKDTNKSNMKLLAFEPHIEDWIELVNTGPSTIDLSTGERREINKKRKRESARVSARGREREGGKRTHTCKTPHGKRKSKPALQ